MIDLDKLIQTQFPKLKPRSSKVNLPLPEDEDLPPDIVKTLADLPHINNLRMFAQVPRCFQTLMTFINQVFHQSKIDSRLREYMYLRISYKWGVLYEFRHNFLFCKHLGISDAEIAILANDAPITQLDEIGNLVCKAAEEITQDIALQDNTLQSLLHYFDVEAVCELIMMVAWFNMLMRYIESTRVPYEDNLPELITGASPLK
jgi:hypothetical protein